MPGACPRSASASAISSSPRPWGGRPARAGAAGEWGGGVWQLVGNAPAWAEPPLKELKLCCIHQDQVKLLPPGATLLAANDFCPFAAYYIDSRVLCFQGHPEMNADYIRILMRLRAADIPEPVRAKADKSLDGLDSDAPGVARWIENFVSQSQAQA